jgi:hypothetical protein
MTTRTFESVTPGEALDDLVLPITRSLIVSGALASRDYQDVHHDPMLSKKRGSPDIFMNILTTNGLVGRYVTDWSGPGGFLKKVDIRLGAPNYPDDTMTLRGEIVETTNDAADAARGVVAVKVTGSNSIGDHVVGTVLVSLPREGS